MSDRAHTLRVIQSEKGDTRTKFDKRLLLPLPQTTHPKKTIPRASVRGWIPWSMHGRRRAALKDVPGFITPKPNRDKELSKIGTPPSPAERERTMG
jgi:hypothetical protein